MPGARLVVIEAKLVLRGLEAVLDCPSVAVLFIFIRMRARPGSTGRCAGRIVGWLVSTSARAGFVLDAVEQAVHDRRPGKPLGLRVSILTAENLGP